MKIILVLFSFSVEIGQNFVVDATMKEEMCASSRLSFAVNDKGQMVSTSKDGPGGIAYSKLHDVITVCLWESYTSLEDSFSTIFFKLTFFTL